MLPRDIHPLLTQTGQQIYTQVPFRQMHSVQVLRAVPSLRSCVAFSMTTTKETPHRAGFVNIIGSPNVGKSTLMNQLVGERLSIINKKAQTTRHRIMGLVNEPDWQIVYSDTPGVLDPAYKLQEGMMKFVRTAPSGCRPHLAGHGHQRRRPRAPGDVCQNRGHGHPGVHPDQ